MYFRKIKRTWKGLKFLNPWMDILTPPPLSIYRYKIFTITKINRSQKWRIQINIWSTNVTFIIKFRWYFVMFWTAVLFGISSYSTIESTLFSIYCWRESKSVKNYIILWDKSASVPSIWNRKIVAIEMSSIKGKVSVVLPTFI